MNWRLGNSPIYLLDPCNIGHTWINDMRA